MHDNQKLTYILTQLDTVLQVLDLKKQIPIFFQSHEIITKFDNCQILDKIVSKINRIVKELKSERLPSKTQDEEDMKEEDESYQQIQKQLQKQQRINRQLIKKELEYKEYQQALFEQFSDLKKAYAHLINQKKKLKDQLYQKNIEIKQMQNQKKMLLKEKKIKDCLTFQTFLNGKIANVDLSFKHSVHKRKSSQENGRLSSNRKKTNYSTARK